MNQKPAPSHQGFFSLYRGLDRSVYVLFFARMINRFGDFVQMLLVLILTSRLGMNEAMAGVLVTAVVFATSIGKFLGGLVADRLSRKGVLAACQLVVAVCYAACGAFFLSDLPSFVPWLILISSPFRGATWPVNNSLVADFTSDEDRGRAYSLLYLGTNMGVAIGPLVAGFLFAHSLVWLFWGASLLMFCSTTIVLCFISSKEAVAVPMNSEQQAVEGGLFHALSLRPMLIAYALLFFIYEFCYSQHTFALPLEFSFLFGADAGASRYGVLMSVNAVSVLVMTPLLTKLTSRFDHVMNMSMATLFYVAGFSLYAAGGGYWLFLFATFVWTNGEILMATNGNVFVNHYAPASHRGRLNGLISVFTGLGATVGPAIGGLLLTGGRYGRLWMVMSALSCVICIGFLSLYRSLRSGKTATN